MLLVTGITYVQVLTGSELDEDIWQGFYSYFTPPAHNGITVGL